MKRKQERFAWHFLGVVLIVATAARVTSLFSLRSDLAIRVPLSDAEHYLETARGLAAGTGWPTGPHFMAPVYPLLLSGLFRLFPAGVETVQWAQLLLGLGTTLVVFLLAHRVDPRSALPAGLFYALCGPAIVFENQVLMEGLLAFSLIAVAYLAGGEGRRADLRFAAAGLLLGIAAAGRPIYLFLLPILLVSAAKQGRTPLLRNRTVWISLIGFCLVVLPPSWHNYKETGRPSFVTVSGGLNFYIGNHPDAEGLYSRPPGLLYLDQDPTGARSASRLAGRALDASEASDFFFQKGIAYILDQPAEAARLWIRKAGYLLSPDEIPQIESLDQILGRHLAVRFLCLIGFPLLFPLALLGLRVTGGERATRAWFLAVLLTSASVHVIFFSTGRYRMALLPALATLAGVGLLRLADQIRSDVRGVRGLWPVGLGILLLILAPRYDRGVAEAWAYHQAGIRYDRIEAPRAAAEMYRKAVELEPGMGESWHNLAATKAREGRYAEAIDDYTRALPLLGNHPLTLYNMAVLYGRLGMDERALEQFDRSVAADPTNAAARVDRGVALYRLARKEEAFSEWRRVARDSPEEPSLRRTLDRLVALGADLPGDLRSLVRSP